MLDEQEVPRAARAVILGGGIVGCSVAYHLTKLGWKDVLLLEQYKLGGGTTWHAAGLVGQLRTSNSLTMINKYSVELYQQLEAETGIATGWKETGSLIVARSRERMTQLRRTAAMAEVFGVEASIIGVREALEKWPYLRTEDLLGAVWLPHDGKVRTTETTMALARGAELRGAKIREGVAATGLEYEHGQLRAVLTGQGRIECDYAVLCGGMWTREFGLKLGIDVPLYPVEHHYVVSAPVAGCHDGLPVGRDPDAMIYFRSEGDSIMLGAFQKYSKAWDVPRIPERFSFELLEEDWEKFEQPLAAGKWRLPVLEHTALPKFVNGPESFTPDNNFIMGQAPGVGGLFIAAGFNSVGIASAGGAGKYLAEWMDAGHPTIDLWSVDPRRFLPLHNSTQFLRERVTEVLGLHYQMAWPNREFETARDLRTGPLHGRLAAAGACFGQKMGIERPLYFAEDPALCTLQYAWERPPWFACSAAEHRACREGVALFDQGSFAKYRVEGSGALAVLQRICANDVDVAPGKAVYTAMLNTRGTFESDLTVARLAQDAFYVVTSSGQAARDADWIRQHVPRGAHMTVSDVTAGHAVLSVMGPASRALLADLTSAPLDNEAFPFGAAREMDVGAARVLAMRVTYMGELGWELHVNADQAALLYDTLHAAGRARGLRNAGHYAINSLRLEKAYRAWGSDISTDEDPIEAGLGFAVAWEKPGGFIGREALLCKRAAVPRKRLASFVLEDGAPLLWGSEPIFRNGALVGYTTSAAYGHTLGASVAMGYVKLPGGATREAVLEGRYEILLDGVRQPARVLLNAPYDPARKKILS
jgi:heterotetrameric sarcosine oxidase gamma subunit